MDEEKKVKKQSRKTVLQSLLEQGKKTGVLGYKEVSDKLEELELDAEQIEKMFEYLEKHGVEIAGTMDDDDIDIDDEDMEISREELADMSVPSNVSIDDPVRMYLKEIGKEDLLSSEEEAELARRMADGDRAAKKKLAEANLRLVVSIA